MASLSFGGADGSNSLCFLGHMYKVARGSLERTKKRDRDALFRFQGRVRGSDISQSPRLSAPQRTF